MPDPDTPPDPNTPPPDAAARVGDTRAEAMLGAAQAPPEDAAILPTVISNVNPLEHSGPGMGTAPMSGASGGMWQPPTVEEAARLFPGYEVLALLGRGGMGAVYKARQIELDRLVAIKLLPLEISADRDFAERFRREARAMAKLNHPNIITVHDFGTTSAGHLYFAMEFVDGANLHQIIHGPGLDPAQTLSITMQVCEALAFAHEQGVVHRDIKPANVMVDQRGRAKVADFGLARLTDPGAAEIGHTMTGTVMGTPDYMAPEQMRGMNVDHRADIYSLGVMLYEMLCKDVPRGFFDPPSQRVGVDSRIDDVVKRAMQQQPERRYQQTGEMKADVDQIRTAMVAPSPSLVAAAQPRVVSAVSADHSAAAKNQISSESRRHTGKSKLVPILAAAVLIVGAITFVMMKSGKRAPVASAVSADSAPGTATATPAAIPPEPAWQPLITASTTPPHLPGKREWSDKRLHLLLNAVNAETPHADGALRARIQFQQNSRAVGLVARSKSTGESYKLNVLDQGSVSLNVIGAKGQRLETLGRHTFPKPLAAGDLVTLELRAQGDRLTGLMNGTAVIEARDTRYPDAGTWGIVADDGWFETAELQPLDAAASGIATAAPLEPAAIRLWNTEAKVAALPKSADVRWENGAVVMTAPQTLTHDVPSRDAIIRGTIRRVSGKSHANIGLRAEPWKSGSGQQSHYRLQPDFEQNKAVLHCVAPDKSLVYLKNWPLPPAKPGSEWVELELRAVGDTLTVVVDRQTLGSVQDTKLTEPGGALIYGDKGSAFRDIVYVPLDQPGTNATAGASTLEPGAIRIDDKTENLTKYGNVRWENSAWQLGAGSRVRYGEVTSRDMIVHATVQMAPGAEGAQLNLRRGEADDDNANFYRIALQPIINRLELDLVQARKSRKLTDAKLPRTYQAGEWVKLEAKVIGDEISVSADGTLIVTFKDSTVSEPGGMMLYTPTIGVFRDVVYVPLDKAGAAPAANAALEPGAIKLWDTPKSVAGNRGARVADGVLIIDGARGGLVVHSQKPSRDAILRASLRTSAELKNASLRLRAKTSAKVTPFYMVGPGPNEKLKGVTLYYSEDGKLEKLKEWPLPRSYGPDDWMRLELHAIGEDLSVVVDGQKLGTVRDNRLLSPGGPGIFADAATVRDIVYVPLDKPEAGAPAPAGGAPAMQTTAEPWRDWLAEKRAEKRLASLGFEDDGTYVQSRGAKGGPGWKPIMRDGAIRVTWKLTGEIGKPGQREPAITLRHGALATPSQPGSYTLDFGQAGLRIDLNTVDASGQAQRIELKTWPLPPGFDRAQEHTLEFRAVGDELSVRLNGQLIGTHRDTRATEGGFGFFPADGALIRKVEYLSLDSGGAASTPPAKP